MKMRKVKNTICLRLLILFVCFSLIGIIPYSGTAFSNNEKHELGVYSLWEYGEIPGTGINWKGSVYVGPPENPYIDFWDTMTQGETSEYAHETSKRLYNSEINYKNVFPVWFDNTKDWGDYDMVFFYGHNNMVTPPHKTDYLWTVWTNNFGSGQDWTDKEDILTDWGTPESPMEYYHYDIIDGKQHPGSVTYLYEPFTSALIGGNYHFKNDMLPWGIWAYQKKCQDTQQGNTKNLGYTTYGLGDKDLDWLILHGCQAVIVCDELGHYPNPIGVNAFKGTYAGFHLILGHWKSFYTSELGDLEPFANNLLSDMPIKAAYFLTQPSYRTSAIAPLAIPNFFYNFFRYFFEDDDYFFDWWEENIFGNYIDDDTWTDPMTNRPFGIWHTTNLNSVVRWHTDWNSVKDLENDKEVNVEKQIRSGKETSLYYLDIDDNEIVKFLGSNKLYVRSKDNALDSGLYPILLLEQITENDAEDLLKQNILKFSKSTTEKEQIKDSKDNSLNVMNQIIKLGQKTNNNIENLLKQNIPRSSKSTTENEQIKDFDSFLSTRVGDTICWVEKASCGYSVQDVENMMVEPTTITSTQEAVDIALKHLIDLQLIELGDGESLDLIFVSNIRKAAYYEDEDEPCEDYTSDYMVGFGRQYKGIPVIGSQLVLRLGRDGELLGVQKNWRNIVGESPSTLTVDDSKLMEQFTEEIISHGIIKSAEDIDKIEVISMSCGYFEGLISNTQEQMGLGCLVNYRHKGDDMILHVGFPIADSDFSLLGEE